MLTILKTRQMTVNDQHEANLNLNDIAQLSGVSRSTVSRVINNHPNVSERTRKRVLEIIEQYSYQPNAVARALVSNSSRVIGVIVPHIITEVFADPFFAMIIQSITVAANEADYGVTLGLTSQADSTNTLNRILNDSLLDGIIIAEASISPDILRQLHLRNKRFVLIGRPPIDDLPIAHVDVENEHGGFLATQHLIARGCQHIVFIPGRPELTSSIDRQLGYEKAMVSAGLQPRLSRPGNFLKEESYQAVCELLAEPAPLDAIFCASDATAMGAIEAIQAHGLRIPEDIAVVGFDDAALASSLSPTLTTVRQDVMLSGKVAAQLLIRLIENPDDDYSQKNILPIHLIVRESA